MNEKNENAGDEQAVEAAHPAQTALRSASRRRLIKLGAAGVPVAATLASSPALAWNCKNPSAWGSKNVVASQKANASNQVREYETWYISDWCTNQARGSLGQPWDQLKAAFPALKNKDNNDITVNDLLNAGAIPVLPRSTSGLKFINLLKGSDNFGKQMVVAMLHTSVGASKKVIQVCTTDSTGMNQLAQMAKGTYKPPGVTKPWSEQDVMDYLYANWMAR